MKLKTLLEVEPLKNFKSKVQKTEPNYKDDKKLKERLFNKAPTASENKDFKNEKDDYDEDDRPEDQTHVIDGYLCKVSYFHDGTPWDIEIIKKVGLKENKMEFKDRVKQYSINEAIASNPELIRQAVEAAKTMGVGKLLLHIIVGCSAAGLVVVGATQQDKIVAAIKKLFKRK